MTDADLEKVIEQLNPDFVSSLMGFPDGWCDGVSRRSMLRMFGNAVLPQVSEVVGLVAKGRYGI